MVTASIPQTIIFNITSALVYSRDEMCCYYFMVSWLFCCGCLSSSQEFLTQKAILDASKTSSSVRLPEGYDMLDIGASKGRGSIDFLKHALVKVFGAKLSTEYNPKSLGIDIDEQKVIACKKAGGDCIVGDVTKLKSSKSEATKVDGITIWHVLEHMPNCKIAEDIWKQSSLMARHFTSFHGPNFDDQYVLEHFHRYYEDWTGHSCHFNSTMLEHSIRTSVNPAHQFLIIAAKPIRSTVSPIIIPKGSKRNSHHYNESIHPTKLVKTFPIVIYEEMRACAIYGGSPTKMSLVSALCMKNALAGSHKVLACQSQSKEGKLVTANDECMTLLKDESDMVINEAKSKKHGLRNNKRKV